jgi:hypothetical protein
MLLLAAGYLALNPTESPGEQYLVALSDMPSNSMLTESNSMSVALNLGDQASRYALAKEEAFPLLLTRAIRAGELIPVSALEDTAMLDCVNLRMVTNLPLSADIHRGDLVDVWSASPNAVQGTIPNQIVTAAQLVSVSEKTDALSQNQTEVELCISRAEVRSVVNSIALKEVVVVVKSQ